MREVRRSQVTNKAFWGDKEKYLTDEEWEEQFDPYMPEGATPEDPGAEGGPAAWMISCRPGPPEGIPDNHVWTLYDGEEDGKQWIRPGRHYVNRFAYFVTRKPWTEDTPDVLYWDDAWVSE